MKIKKILNQMRRDFTAIFECGHCGFEEKRDGYDDAFFHRNVIPSIKCDQCGKTAGDDYRLLAPKYDEGLFTPYEAILLKGHLDENEVREALEDELGDKDHVERLMRREPIHTYGKPLPQGTWWLTPDPRPRQRTTPVTLIG